MRNTGKDAPKKIERVVDRLRFGLRDRLEKRITVVDGPYRFAFACTTRLEVFRAKTLLSKEAGTCEWLRSELRPDDVFYDIGANIGLYTVLAGRLGIGGLRVFAFEPHAENFVRLCQNIRLNGLSEIVTPLSAALTDRDGWFPFDYLSWQAASSASQLGETRAGTTGGFRELKAGASIDSLVAGGWLPAPTVMKIDVDGLEPNIVRGMARLLVRADRPRCIQIEIQKGDTGGVLSLMQQHGYELHRTHLSAGGKRKLARGKTMNDITYNAIFTPRSDD